MLQPDESAAAEDDGGQSMADVGFSSMTDASAAATSAATGRDQPGPVTKERSDSRAIDTNINFTTSDDEDDYDYDGRRYDSDTIDQSDTDGDPYGGFGDVRIVETGRPRLKYDEKRVRGAGGDLQLRKKAAAGEEYVTSANRCCNDRLWCVKDPCGSVCVFITYCLLVYAEFVFTFLVVTIFNATVRPADLLAWAVFQAFVTLAVVSHQRSMLSDPGAVPVRNFTREAVERVRATLPLDSRRRVIVKCVKCVSIKPDRAHHCSVCRRCIRKMDHHCPWINNCVGEANQKYFILFNLYICLLSAFVLVFDGLRLWNCSQLQVKRFYTDAGDPVRCSPYTFASDGLVIGHCLALAFVALLFFLFTLIMMCTQICAVWSDTTAIESWKKDAASATASKAVSNGQADDNKDDNATRLTSRQRWRAVEDTMGPFSVVNWLSPFVPPSSVTREARHSMRTFAV